MKQSFSPLNNIHTLIRESNVSLRPYIPQLVRVEWTCSVRFAREGAKGCPFEKGAVRCRKVVQSGASTEGLASVSTLRLLARCPAPSRFDCLGSTVNDLQVSPIEPLKWRLKHDFLHPLPQLPIYTPLSSFAIPSVYKQSAKSAGQLYKARGVKRLGKLTTEDGVPSNTIQAGFWLEHGA